MNLTLHTVIHTTPSGDRFYRLPEIYIRGNNIKFLRVQDAVIEQVREQQQKELNERNATRGISGRGGGFGGGRGGQGFRGGRGGERGGRGGRGGGRGGDRGGRGTVEEEEEVNYYSGVHDNNTTYYSYAGDCFNLDIISRIGRAVE